MAIEIKNETEQSADLYLSGSIIDDMGGIIDEWCDNSTGYQWPEKIRSQLEGLKGKALTIYINSDGGSVPAGVAMANMIARHDAPTTAIVDGWCCSIATQIFCAADRRQMPTNAYLMIHKPAVYASGNADDLRRSADVLDTIQRGLEETYQKAALEGVTAELLHKLVNDETWLTAREAAEVFDVELLEASQMTACAGSAKFMQHIPECVRRMMEENLPQEQLTAETAEESCQKAAMEMRQRAEIALALAKGAMI